MSRGKKRKRPGWQERRRRQERADEQLFDDVASDTAAVFTCSRSTAEDFAGQCADRLEELDADIQFNQVAAEIWSGRPGRAGELAAALAALCTERERQRDAMTALCDRFEALARDEAFDEHLDPVAQWREFIRQRLFPDPPSR